MDLQHGVGTIRRRADGGRQRDVFQRAERRVCGRRGDGHADLEVHARAARRPRRPRRRRACRAPPAAAAAGAAAGRRRRAAAGRAGRSGGRGPRTRRTRTWTRRAADAAGTALRGPAYWPGTAEIGPRIYSTTTPGLAAIDAKTGKLVTTFGENGVLPGITPTSPPAIYKNILITQGDREPGKGLTVKGFDVVSGKLVWTFYLKAQPGDPNRATWLDGSAESEATPDIWGLFTDRRAARHRLRPGREGRQRLLGRQQSRQQPL